MFTLGAVALSQYVLDQRRSLSLLPDNPGALLSQTSTILAADGSELGSVFGERRTSIVLAEMGFSEFAAGVYHDWAGLLFFFPIALAGLFGIDKALNWNENKKVVRKRIQE